MCANGFELPSNISLTMPVPLIAQCAGESVDLAEAVVEAKVRHVVGGERKIGHAELMLHLEELLHTLRVLLVLLQDARRVKVHGHDPVEERGICVDIAMQTACAFFGGLDGYGEVRHIVDYGALTA